MLTALRSGSYLSPSYAGMRPTTGRVVAPRPPMSPLQNPNQKKRWENVDRSFKI